ncbi:hypothetical protein [Pontibacter sp. G13]|uniref:hypothetical protein n=1 Tax=Pontibacter sp. G13 TaxID=3074898 RepID=UPI002889DA42|nr:hypothetical protein [Pontibacter sp. G13]WNJ19553.1 hypothetical protein RJD25_03595 [Pontibacter sp. G13]
MIRPMRFAATTLFIATAALFGCGEDDNITPSSPDLEFISGSGFITDDVTVEPGSTLNFRIRADRGDAALDQLSILENNNPIGDLTRLTVEGAEPISNPISLSGDDRDGLTYTITIASSSSEESIDYAFRVTDSDGLLRTIGVTVTTEEPGTPVSERTGLLLSNSAGPAGKGGLDLSTGSETGSSSGDADLVDEGIDLNQPFDQNWIQMFSSTNGAELRTPASGLDYDAVLNQEDIVAAYNAGTPIATTEIVNTGDLFLVLADNVYYLLEVTDVVITGTASQGDNTDYYEFSVKE